MKKAIQFLSFMIISCFFICNYEDVSAIKMSTPTDCYQTGNEMVCNIKFTIESGALTHYDYNIASVNFQVNNLKVTSFVPSSSWYVESNHFENNKYSYSLKTTLANLEVGKTYTIATVHLTKIDVLTNCKFALSPIFLNQENRSCSVYQGVYYGKDGSIVSAFEWDKQCNTHVCEKLSDGTYFGKNGNIVDASTYLKECGHVCEFYDGKYYGSNGTEVDQNTYNEQCNPKCKIQDGKYYGSNGNIVSELDYQKECGKNVCTILSDGTIYGKNGNVVDKLTYQKECGNNYCIILSDGTIYGKDGTVVNQETFDKECKDSNYCQIIDGKYYGANGNETTEMDYKIQCENHKCEIIEGNYFDKDGNLVSEATYKEQCEKKYSCEIIGDNYYDKSGKQVSKADYDASCKEVKENPKTGAVISILSLFGLGISGVGILYFARKHNRLV